MRVALLDDEVWIWLGPLPLTKTMVVTTLLSMALMVAAMWLARAVVQRPDGKASAACRISVRFLQNLIRDAAGELSVPLEAFGGTLFLFIAGCALIGQLPGVEAPTSNLATSSALACLVFFAVPIAGISRKGLRAYLKHYARPNLLLAPLHLISEVSRALALSLRLFGNMMSGHLVVALLVVLVGLLVPIPLMALDLLIGLLQAYIFTILACVYVGSALRVGEEE